MAGERVCLFCPIARSSTTTPLLHSDNSVVAFQDIKPAAFRHYLVIPVKHISTVKNLERRTEDFELVNHMLNVGKGLLQRDAPYSEQYRFGFHQPPFNSVDHLHLHCLALPFIPKDQLSGSIFASVCSSNILQGLKGSSLSSFQRFNPCMNGAIELLENQWSQTLRKSRSALTHHPRI